VAAREHGDQGKVDNPVLAEDDRGRRLAHFLDLGTDLFDAIDKLGLVRGKCCHGFSFAQSWG
jgi:hypothetical protein